jgi:hypothetical protein
MFFIPKENVDTNLWDIPDGYMNKNSKKKLLSGDYIKIQVIDKRINQNDSQIKILGKLLDFATKDQVEKYFGNKIVTEKIIDGTEVVLESDQVEIINVDQTNNESNETNFII